MTKDLNLTDKEIAAQWDAGNGAGKGYAVGEQSMTPLEAAKAEEFTDIRTFATRTELGRNVVGRNCLGEWVAIVDVHGPWAVDITEDEEAVDIATGYTSDYQQELTGKGREVRIADEMMSYYYPLAEGDSLDDAVAAFAASYDYNLDPGQDPAGVKVGLSAEEYLDGQKVRAIACTVSPAPE